MSYNPFLQRKWDRVFYTFFDLNKNGSIDYNDFEVLFANIAELRGEQSTEYKIAVDAMMSVWKGLLSAAKGIDLSHEPPPDVTVSIEEWRKIWSEYNPRHMPIWQWEYLKYMFFLLDTSGDKYIDVHEYVDVMKIYKIEKDDATTAFTRFAVDAQGKKQEKIDYGDFLRLWNEYFMGKDEWIPGNYIFGSQW